MKGFLLAGVFTLASCGAMAHGKYYEFQGEVSKVSDVSNEQTLASHYASGHARYVVYVDPSEQGFWYSNAGKKLLQKNDSRTRYAFASYSCGNALDLQYLNSDYYFAEEKNTVSLMHTKLTVGRRLDITVNDVQLPTLAVNDAAVGVETFWLSGSPKSMVTSALTLVAIYDRNPCE
ncbi:hypothetical protein [Aeromonas veronii]|uniref:Lipoprotein n=1 Tax=Aeromonas veronii TaxID=654 RepID=A0A4V3Z038_AERVE|nr:hypothetical protein [Aeromonas veronii]THJ44962.1 hypothetical protein E8Q35_12290 [Aeromonas veronii]